MLDRRQLLQGCAATSLAVGCGPLAWAQQPDSAGLNALLGQFAEAVLQSSPETAAGLGLDTGAHADLKRRLDHRSWAAVERSHADSARWADALKGLDRKALSGAAATNYDAALYACELGADAAAFSYGDNTFLSAMGESATPYVVSQQAGAFSAIPEFLNSEHLIDNADDADAYLARLAAFPVALAQHTERVRRDTAQGVIAPDFILDTTLTQMKAFLAQPAAEQGLVQSLVKRAAAKGLSGDYAGPATRLVEDAVYPAVAAQVVALTEARAKAGHDAGVWRLPQGEAYYAWCLRVGTSTPLDAEAIHQMGLEQHAAITARMDGLLKARGLTQGTVGERMIALAKDPANLFPDTDAGRAQTLDYLNGRIAAVRPLMPRLSHLQLKAAVEAKRVPPDIELGQGLGYMNPGSLDGSRPSIYYINLHDMRAWPRFALPTLTYHETIPGHVWQGAYVSESHNLPLFNTMLGFNAYIEGWALYAEQMADEIGLYDDDPLGRLGYLQAQDFRACRLVADTGLHAKRWSREQAVSWMVAATGKPTQAIVSEIDRYCAGPGQACGYKVGHSEILRLRDKARTALGPRFDLAGYNDAVVTAGSVPLTVLARVVDDYVTAQSRG